MLFLSLLHFAFALVVRIRSFYRMSHIAPLFALFHIRHLCSVVSPSSPSRVCTFIDGRYCSLGVCAPYPPSHLSLSRFTCPLPIVNYTHCARNNLLPHSQILRTRRVAWTVACHRLRLSRNLCSFALITANKRPQMKQIVIRQVNLCRSSSRIWTSVIKFACHRLQTEHTAH